jgi:hypothetical protein
MAQTFRRSSAILIIILASSAAAAFAPMWAGRFLLPATIIALLTMIGAATLAWRTPSPTVLSPTDNTDSFDWLRTDTLFSTVGVGLLVLLTVWQFALTPAEPVQFAVWLAGIIVLTYGLSGLRFWRWRWNGDRRLMLLLLTLFTIAFVLRLFGLEGRLRVLVDEMQVIAPIVATWDETLPLLHQIDPYGYPYPYIYPYIQQAGSAIFGYSLFTFRLMSVWVGTLTVLSTFALAQTLFNRQIAWLSAVALAVLPMHLHFSRLGIVNIYDPLLATLAFTFVARGFQHGGRQYWVLAGACLGMTHYLYEGGRLLHTPLTLLWVGLIWGSSRLGVSIITRLSSRKIGQGVGWMLLTSALLAAPLYITWIGTDVQVFGRLASQSVTDTPPLLEEVTEVDSSVIPTTLSRLRDSALLYVSLIDEWMFFGGRQPMIPVFVVPFFLIGLGAGLLQRRQWALTVLPAMWLLATVTATGLFIWNPTHAARHTVALPAVAILIALGVWLIASSLFIHPRRQLITAWVVMGLLGVGQITYYFADHLPAYNFQARWIRDYADPDDAVLRMTELPPNTHHYIVMLEAYFPPEHPNNFLTYISDGTPPPLTLVLSGWLTEDFLRRLPRDVNHAFFVETGNNNAEAIERLVRFFPDLEPSFSPDTSIELHYQLALFFIPATKAAEDVPPAP